MAKIRLDNIAHSYGKNPKTINDFALRKLDMEWEDGKAYALLGPSGCGKSTLLNIISGLLMPSHGSIMFNDKNVTSLTTAQRNIAQVFQFPVVYDTMSVYDNLAFPLRNRSKRDKENVLSAQDIDKKVRGIAQMLSLTDMLSNKAQGLSADAKQTISLGRGLVRDDVNAILFDEPLTVIDPHLKWQLRSKLKYLHKQFDNTMIYVTHDQTEALTFADEVVVMSEGEVVQLGTPEALFQKPEHTFVGYFIGSPGMNVLPANFIDANTVKIADQSIKLSDHYDLSDLTQDDSIELGIRPEFITISSSSDSQKNQQSYQASVVKIDDVGRHQVVRLSFMGQIIHVVVDENQGVASDTVNITFDPSQIHMYKNGWRIKSQHEESQS